MPEALLRPRLRRTPAPEAPRALLRPRLRRTPAPPATPPPAAAASAAPAVSSVIRRILAADGEGQCEAVLGLEGPGDVPQAEGAVTAAWKRLTMLLHPDKLHHL